MVALRHVDVNEYGHHQEHSALYDLRMLKEDYRFYCSIQQKSQRYLKYIDRYSNNPFFNKDFSFSRDGRVLASPHQREVWLLAMDNSCTPVEIDK